MSYEYNQPFEHVNMEALVAATQDNGIITGLVVSERGAGQNQSVDVSSGSCNIDGVAYTESITTNVALDAAHITLPRKDLVYYDALTGNPSQIAGIAATSPVPPNIPSGDVLLAVVNRSTNDNTVTNTDIDDGRVYIMDKWSYTTVSSNTILNCAHKVVTVNGSGGNRTITLPTAVGIRGKLYVIKKIDSSNNTVTIDPNGAETIDGESTMVINHQNTSVVIMSDNTGWRKISEHQPSPQWSLARNILPTTDGGWNVPAGNLVNVTDSDIDTHSSEAIHNQSGALTEKITIDLGSLKNIIQISSIANIKSGTAYETSMTIYTSTDNISYTLINTTSSGLSGNYVKKHLIANPLEKIRYIQIQFYQYNMGPPTDNGYFKLHEVGVFGWD